MRLFAKTSSTGNFSNSANISTISQTRTSNPAKITAYTQKCRNIKFNRKNQIQVSFYSKIQSSSFVKFQFQPHFFSFKFHILHNSSTKPPTQKHCIRKPTQNSENYEFPVENLKTKSKYKQGSCAPPERPCYPVTGLG